jgi:hypothetical protein
VRLIGGRRVFEKHATVFLNRIMTDRVYQQPDAGYVSELTITNIRQLQTRLKQVVPVS